MTIGKGSVASAASTSARFGGDNHALSGGETVGLQDHRIAEVAGDVRRGLGYDLEPRGRNAQLLHEALGMDFASLEGRVFSGRTDDRQASRAKLIDDAGDQRHFGSDDGQIRRRDVRLIRHNPPIHGIRRLPQSPDFRALQTPLLPMESYAVSTQGRVRGPRRR